MPHVHTGARIGVGHERLRDFHDVVVDTKARESDASGLSAYEEGNLDLRLDINRRLSFGLDRGHGGWLNIGLENFRFGA